MLELLWPLFNNGDAGVVVPVPVIEVEVVAVVVVVTLLLPVEGVDPGRAVKNMSDELDFQRPELEEEVDCLDDGLWWLSPVTEVAPSWLLFAGEEAFLWMGGSLSVFIPVAVVGSLPEEAPDSMPLLMPLLMVLLLLVVWNVWLKL